VTVLLEYIDLLIIITIISCSIANYCVWLLYWVYFDLYSAKFVGILLLENLFSQNLPIMLAFLFFAFASLLFPKFCRQNRCIPNNMTGFVKRGLPYTSILSTSTIHNFRLQIAIALKFAQYWVPTWVDKQGKFQAFMCFETYVSYNPRSSYTVIGRPPGHLYSKCF